jgi:uncharacterized protein involved in exopolysaccharide biosynthesis
MRDTELTDLFWVLLRWSWLIILIVVATVGSLVYLQRRIIPAYEATVTLLLSTPDREDVNVTGEYTFTNDRDEITNTSDRFVSIAEYDEVKQRTLEELGLSVNYRVDAAVELGADFVTITVNADAPELAAALANTHAQNAIEYFGEIRALPATQALEYFDVELEAARQNLEDAQQALTDFHIENDIIMLEDEIDVQNTVLETLEVLRVEVQVPVYDPSIDFVPSRDTTTVDGLITEQRTQINNLGSLLPEYQRLVAEVEAAEDAYDLLVDKYAETEMRQAFTSQSMFLQIIDAAEVPDAPTGQPIRTYTLGFVGSLGLGILLAFFLDYLFVRR